ncbi:MAG: MBOAT family protein [Lachnospiraceae bacterium]|nr:MBOAT family protein [Lachnospiraceae bacterium]
MVFSSLIFLTRFLPVFFAVYLLTPAARRNLVLFLGSLFFYGWGEPVYIGLMLFSAVLDYGNGLLIARAKAKNIDRLAGAVLAESVLVNLSLLGVFKYGEVLPLPVGISFYTFQTMSYTIDVYRGETKAQRDFVAFGAYIAMFPQLIAGPIVKYKDVEGELVYRPLSLRDGCEGIGRFCMGLGKKVLLANQIGLLWEAVQKIPPGQMSTAAAWMGSAAFALQLYYDFSGYSDMAIGMAQMIGFHLKENFCYPYRSKSITEFWRRWHISLGQWFRDYVYIPLGGNRRGWKIQLRNILIVWALTGIWHGKGWNFLAWGMYFGVLLILEKWFLLGWLSRLPAVCGHLYAVLAAVIGMTVFALEELPEGLSWIGMLFGSTGRLWNAEALWLLSNDGFLFLICLVGAAGLWKKPARWPVLWFLSFFLSIAYLVDAAYNPFLYFRF